MTTSKTQKPLLGKFRMTGILAIKTGLHIGGGGENLSIGGLDKAVARDPLTKEPYLPGSSIKGKLRSILERFYNEPLNRSTYTGGMYLYRHECDSADPWLLTEGSNELHVGANECPVCRIFGATGKSDALIPGDKGWKKEKGLNYPARLIIRDSHLLTESANKLKQIDTGLYMTEWKFENGLDRVTAAANPRQVERIPAGSKFGFELIYTVEDEQQAVEDLKSIAIAISILEDDALGGHGSRGYGKVEFETLKLYYRGIDQYRNLTAEGSTSLTPIATMENTAVLLEQFGTLTTTVNRLLPGSEA